MPKRRTDDVVHVVMTDHFIRRKQPPRDLLAPIQETHDGQGTAYRGEVVLYYPPELPDTPENELYLALAQVIAGANLEGGIPRLADAIERHQPERAAQAKAVLDEAVAIDPDLPEAWNNLGEALVALDDRAGAIDAWRNAVRIQPAYAVALSNLANNLNAAGGAAEAEFHYK